MHGKGNHLQGEGTICMEWGTICRLRGPFAGRGDLLLDRATSGWCRAHMRGEEPSVGGENHMHGKENHLHGDEVICMERGTIFGGGGDYKQRKIVPSTGGETICEGQDPIFKKREPFQSSVFLQSTK